MADLRIVDAPLLSTVKGTEKLPTGGEGNFSVSVNQVVDFAKLKWVLATEGYVDNAVGNAQSDLNLHKNNESNPHNVTKTQVGLGNVDNTADLDKPVSNATQSAITTANSGKADKSYVDSQDQLKADKTTVEASLLLKADKVDLTASKIASDGGQTQQSVNDFGGARWYSKSGGYELGATAKLANGDIVKSTVANNIINPNVDMTGWFNETRKTKFITDYGAKQGLDHSSDTVFALAVADLSDGDKLIVDGSFYLENNWLINKEIDVEVRGDIYLNGDNDNAVIISAPVVKEIIGINLVSLPRKFDNQIFLTEVVKSELGNLSDYFISIRSTEKLVNRLGYTENDSYKKWESNYFTHNDGSLANSLYISYLDSAKFYACIYRKNRQVTIKNLAPKIKAGTFSKTTRAALVIVQGRSNINWIGCGFDKNNAESMGYGFTIIDSTLMSFDDPRAERGNKTGGDSYAFLSTCSSYLTFKLPKNQLSTDLKRDRFYSSRHSSKIAFDNLVGSFDEHWGYDYTLNNYVCPKDSRITFAGGDLTINNIDSSKEATGSIIVTRTDTPYCEGTLRINGGKTRGCILYDYLDIDVINQDFTRKSFDTIILEGSVQVYDSGELPIFAFRNYDVIDKITQSKTNIILRDVIYTRKADANSNGGLISNQGSVKQIGSLTIDNLTKKIDGADTLSTKYPLLKNIRSDSVRVLNIDKFTFQDLFTDSFDVIGGSIGDEKLGFYNLSVVDHARFTSTTLNESMSQYSVFGGMTDKIFYIGCDFKTSYLLTNATLAAAISGAYANSFDASIPNTLYTLPIDITNYTNPSRVRNLRSTYSLLADVTVPANGVSATYPPTSNISLNGARVGDFTLGAISVGNGLEVVTYCSANNTVNFYLKNNSASPVTVVAGTVIKFKVI